MTASPGDPLHAAGYELPSDSRERLAAYVALLHEYNQRLNLTAARDEAALWHHVCDSLAVFSACAQPPRRLVDVGSGGGFPGLALACVWPQTEIVLLDATRKKVDALRAMVSALGLSHVEAVWGRAEQLACEPRYRERYDLATARAVTNLATLVQSLTGFVRQGGEVLCFKSAAGAEREAAEAAQHAAKLALRPAAPHTYRLPGDEVARLLVRYEKIATLPPVAPPRRKAAHGRSRRPH